MFLFYSRLFDIHSAFPYGKSHQLTYKAFTIRKGRVKRQLRTDNKKCMENATKEMAMAKRPARTEALTIRLDPKTRFMLEFVVRLRGQTITTVVERAIAQAADEATVETAWDEVSATWRDYWNVSEGIRALKMAANPKIHSTYEEERRFAFAKEHWCFFWMDSYMNEYNGFFIDILWPRIDEFIELHDANKRSDYFKAGRAMRDALEKAKIEPPTWPQPNGPIQEAIPF